MRSRVSALLGVAALCFCASPAAATTLDFEDLGANLPIFNPDTGENELFYNGSSAHRDGQPTPFSSRGATFANDFDDFGGGCCWRGWAYSQTTDTTTPGFGNQHSAVAGSGVGGSATYGVAFTGGVEGSAAQGPISPISFARDVELVGGWFTNTTYAALSMRDGDGFAKQFGGPSGSDPDFLNLSITGRDELGDVTGSVLFYLADFRFADDSQDYILMDWSFVDLSVLGSVRSLEFAMDSSDKAGGFINTPTYFALDGLVFTPEPGTAALLALGLVGLGAARRRG